MSPSYWAVILTAERNPPAERHLPDLLINPTAFVFQALFSFLPICAEPTFQSQTDDVLQQTVAFNTASWSLNVFVTHAMPVLRQYWWMLPWGSAEIAQEPLWWGQSSLWGDQSEQWAEIPKPGGTAHSTQPGGDTLALHPSCLPWVYSISWRRESPLGSHTQHLTTFLPPGEVASLWFVSGSTLLCSMQTFECSLQ